MLFFSNGAPPNREASSISLLLRALELAGWILLACCLLVTDKKSKQRISISATNVPLQKLFAEIEKKTNYTFSYDVTILKDTKPVTVEMKDASVEDILKIALSNQSLAYSITDRTIFIKKEKKAVSEEVPGGGGPPVKAKGVVYNEAGVPIAGATVTIKQTEKGTITNAKVEFELLMGHR